MFGFGVKTLQNGFGVGVESPKADVGEIDTRAPFESVKAALSLFGAQVQSQSQSPSPRARPVTKKTKAEEQKLLEKETQHHMVIKELEYHKDQLRLIQTAKDQAHQDLHRANQTLQELTGKLENLSESKQVAIKSSEAAKRRSKQLQDQSIQAQLVSNAWKRDLDIERDRYKASSGDLIAAKQELANLRQDFDAVLEAKIAAFQKIEDARQASKASKEKETKLAKEVGALRLALDQVKFDSMHAHEEHLKLIAEKEVHLLVHISAKEVAENEMKGLRQLYVPRQDIARKLEETTEAIKVMQEQIHDVRASDLDSLQTAVTELDCTRKELHSLVAQEASMQCDVDELEQQLDEAKKEYSKYEKKALEAESSMEEMKVSLEERKIELEFARSRDIKTEMESNVQSLLAEAERNRVEAEKLNKDGEELKLQAESAKMAAKETDQKLQIALKEAEAAKTLEKLAEEKIREGDLKITLSVDEFKAMNRKIEESRTNADITVASLMSEVQKINENQNEVLQNIDKILKEKEDLQIEIDRAFKREEVDDAARKVVEGELQKCRIVVGEPSGIL